MSVAAAALPDLARDRDGAIGALLERTVSAVRRVAFFVVPSFVAFVAIGDVLVAGLYRAGEFGAADARVVWLVLIGYSLGLVASTTTRVYQSAFFALRDTATPARAAFVRVLVALAAGAVLMVQFESVTVLGYTIPAGALAGFNVDGLPLGPLGLAAGAAVGAWVEWALLKRVLGARLGQRRRRVRSRSRACSRRRLRPVPSATSRAARSSSLQPLLAALVVASVFGAVYFAVAMALGLEQARALVAGLLRRVRRR